MSDTGTSEDNPERAYWRIVSDWVRATKRRYRGFSNGDLTQCFMRGPFAGWSEREVSELANRLCENAKRFPVRGHEHLKWEDEIEAEGDSVDFYCPVCQSCGEDGCCSVEKSILQHGCKYANHYAKQACYSEMIIDEFHQLAEKLGLIRDETGAEVKDPIGDLYDRAWRRVEEKYGSGAA